MEAAFTDHEKRSVLSEVIKTSSVPVEKLLAFINENDVRPIWNDMELPFRRSINACIKMLEGLRGGLSPSILSHPAALAAPAPARKRKSAPEALEPLQAVHQAKRRQSGADNMIRIQPKPSSNGSPLSFSTPPLTQPVKKRGRPSKAEVEARNAAAIARGEVLPPPRTLAARESIGGEASAESSISVGGFGVMAATAPVVPSGLQLEPNMRESLHERSPEAEIRETDIPGKKKRGRLGSRSSNMSSPTESGEHKVDNLQRENKQSKGSFSTPDVHFGQFEIIKAPVAKPTEERSELLAAKPEPPQDGGNTTPVNPTPQALVSPLVSTPHRSERS